MTLDPVFQEFLTTAAAAAPRLCEQSDVLRLAALPTSGSPPRRYAVEFLGCEHVERSPKGRFRFSRAPISARVAFSSHYCRTSTGPFGAGESVFFVESPVIHPNISGGQVCIASAVLPGTALKPLLSILYAVLSSRVYCTESPLDGTAARYYDRHLDRIRRLRVPPLWRSAP